jgi:ubiquinone/menaquinone biosynthesis C-methylase UbiE
MAFEYMLENNALRSRVREMMEVRPLRSSTDVGDISHALHIACGNGNPTQLILKYFSPQRVSAIDRDDSLIADARTRYGSDVLDFSVQDARSLSFGDERFDAVFDLADLHNYPDWRRGVSELKRVLKPGGLLILEELSQESFAHAAGKLFKALTDHPYDAMLTTSEFYDHLLHSGFEILHFKERIPFGLLKYFTVVARKA